MDDFEPEYRRVGTRFLIIRPDEIEIFRNELWHLVKIGKWSNEKFSNFKLFYYKKAKKNVWQLTASINGMVVTGRDYRLLLENYPKETVWICEKIMEHMNGEETNQQSAGD
jgi:hypothetical protein